MKFEPGDETDSRLRTVLFHEFITCESAFDAFVLYAGMNTMGAAGKDVKLNSYDAYSTFLVKLYEFYVGCAKRAHGNTSNIRHDEMDALLTAEAEKLIRRCRDAIANGYAPNGSNHISYYEEPVPPEFGQEFRRVRNNLSHADYRRAGVDSTSLKEFYRKYHKFVYILFDTARFSWSGRTHSSQIIDHVEEFDFRPVASP